MQPEGDGGTRVEGAGGLSDLLRALERRHSDDGPGSVALVFDFDRTLTNGFSAPSESSDCGDGVDGIDYSRFRGGKASYDAVVQCPFPKMVLTARPPTRSDVDTLASCDRVVRAYAEAGALDVSGDIEVVDAPSMNGSTATTVPIARKGSICAAGYDKSAALAYIASQSWPNAERLPLDFESPQGKDKFLYFIDDNVNNAYEADVCAEKLLVSCYRERMDRRHLESISIRGIWWDTYLEEFGCDGGKDAGTGTVAAIAPTMRPPAFGADFSLRDEYLPALAHYGITDEDMDARVKRYESFWSERRIATEGKRAATEAAGEGKDARATSLGKVEASESVAVLFGKAGRRARLVNTSEHIIDGTQQDS